MDEKVKIISILVIIVLAAFWLFGLGSSSTDINKELTTQEVQELNIPELAQPDQRTQSLTEQGTSDELESIQQDVSNTDLTDLDKELADIDSQLNF